MGGLKMTPLRAFRLATFAMLGLALAASYRADQIATERGVMDGFVPMFPFAVGAACVIALFNLLFVWGKK